MTRLEVESSAFEATPSLPTRTALPQSEPTDNVSSAPGHEVASGHAMDQPSSSPMKLAAGSSPSLAKMLEVSIAAKAEASLVDVSDDETWFARGSSLEIKEAISSLPTRRCRRARRL